MCAWQTGLGPGHGAEKSSKVFEQVGMVGRRERKGVTAPGRCLTRGFWEVFRDAWRLEAGVVITWERLREVRWRQSGTGWKGPWR